MSKQLKVAKLLAPTVPLVLEVEEVEQKLELKLAWTMRAVILLETKLREYGIQINVLQNPKAFWNGLDCASLALGIWAMALQEQPEYGTPDGFDVIASYIVPENYGDAVSAMKKAFLESLSKKRREEILEAEARELEEQEQAEKKAAEKKSDDPTPAPAQ